MESKNRTLWIFVAAVVALGLMCCCALAAVGALVVPSSVRGVLPEGVNWPPVQVQVPGLETTERIQQSFEVGGAPRLTVNNFAGSVTIRRGDSGIVAVAATKRARGARDLDAIVVQMSGQACCVEITTNHPTLPSISNGSVKLEITVPADTILDLRTGAGSIEVSDVQGALRVEAGAGSLVIRGAAGPVNLTNGAGSIDYEGSPAGQCSFRTGAGSITLRIPADANLTVDLSAGLGGVHSELPVSGTVTRRSVRGSIGTGSQGNLTASAGVGSIDLLRGKR